MLPPSSGLDRDGLIAFAASRAPWLAAVFTDLQRQTEDETAPQIVLVERHSADVARWVVLASTVLPRRAVHRLTFTTYTRRPHLAGQRIIGVLPDDAHGLAGSGRRHRVHDCTVPPSPTARSRRRGRSPPPGSGRPVPSNSSSTPTGSRASRSRRAPSPRSPCAPGSTCRHRTGRRRPAGRANTPRS
ncbi:hypothetical protein AAGT00_30175 [Streptomyces cavourensis]